jgi:hypothetical protein
MWTYSRSARLDALVGRTLSTTEYLERLRCDVYHDRETLRAVDRRLHVLRARLQALRGAAHAARVHEQQMARRRRAGGGA